MLSIIIPTLNEEKNLPRLLTAIRKEDIEDLEIVVADAGSKDKTIEIARAFNCVVTKGGLPAVGRNRGVKVAKGDILLFLDADIILSEGFLKNALEKFSERDLSIASFPIYPQKNNIYLNPFTLDLVYNVPQKLFDRLFPMGAMGIMVKNETFKKVKGFDKTIKLAEDVFFVQECAKLGTFEVIDSSKLYMPIRRFQKDGYIRTGVKYLLCAMHMVFIGPVRSDILKYTFDYDKIKK